MFNNFDSIQLGDTKTLVKSITEADVRRFVEMTGDDNPLHVDRNFAETTAFRDVVVHGMLGASFISTVIGTKLPGPGALWMSQNMDFLLPVRLGDELTISVTVLKKHDRDQLVDLDTRIFNQHQQLVLAGTGRVKLLATNKQQLVSTVQKRPMVAIVTGGSGGIGRAICLKLAANGYHVIVNYFKDHKRATDIVEEINFLDGGAKAIAVQADVSTESGAQSLYQIAVNTFGGVSVLVNNASPRINAKSLDVMSWHDVQQQIDVQAKGAFLMTKAVVPNMREHKWGRIINITSQALDNSPSVNWTGYAMAKGALQVFSKYMAAELGPHGITVNCVSPGMCETPLIGDIPEKAQLMVAQRTPMRRLATPNDVAAAVCYFVDDQAGFVTGDTIAVNGGLTMR